MGNTIYIEDTAPHLLVIFENSVLPHETTLTLMMPTTPAPITLIVKNVGSYPLDLLGIPVFVVDDEEIATLDPIPEDSSVLPGESLPLVITYSQPFTGTLVIHSNDVQIYHAVEVVVKPTPQGPPQECTWEGWEEWSTCSVQCGGGVMQREQECECPEGVKGECMTEAQGLQSAPCNLQVCGVDLVGMWECEWDVWGDWTDCSRECGGGQQWRKQTCNCPHLKPMEYDYSFCDGDQPEDVAPCNVQDCCTWSDFGPWSHCSEQCPDGVRVRTQMCTCPDYAYEYGFDETSCTGKPNQQQEPCSLRGCCEWIWDEWSNCTGRCGGSNGGRMHTRTDRCECEPGTNTTCDGDVQTQQILCEDGEEGVTCPHDPDYWMTKSTWVIPNTTLVNCSDPSNPKAFLTWSEVLSHPPDDTWFLLARYAIATALSHAAGAVSTPDVDTALNNSFALLSDTCDELSTTSESTAKILASTLQAYTNGDLDPTTLQYLGSASVEGSGGSSGGGDSGTIGGENGGLVATAVVVPIVVLGLLVLGVWFGMRTWKGYNSLQEEGDEDVDMQQLRNRIDEQKPDDDEADPLDVTALEELQL